jgi:hypothetical protein
MVEETAWKPVIQGTVTIEEVNRLLEIGRLLFSVLAPEEIVLLHQVLNNQENSQKFGFTKENEIGNTSVT